MSDPTRERPAIHVCLAGPAQPGLYRWVQVGAEEEGLPTRHVAHTADDVVAAAYAAAQGSRFSIGVAVGEGRVVLHEAHMPPRWPVLTLELGADGARACRLMGSNAARLVVRLPLRLEEELEPSPAPEPPPSPDARRPYRSPYEPLFRQCEASVESRPDVALDVAEVTRITMIVARILRERGIL